MTRHVSVGLSLIALLVACGSTPAPATTPDQACGDQAHAKCSKLNSCYPTVFAERYPDETTCEAREKQLCLNELSAASTGSNPDRVERCIGAEQGTTWACGDFLFGVNTPPDCAAPQGTLAIGAPCGFAGQCASAYCSTGPNTNCGTCAAQPQAGDSCATASCGSNLNCSGAKTCVTPAALNAPCNATTAPCAADLLCVGAAGTTSGTCQTAVAMAGSPCDSKNATGPSCDTRLGLACNGMTKTCQTVPPAGANAQCGAMNNVNTPCAGDGFCNAAPGMAGTCIPPAADGAACDTASGPNCQTPARCVTASTGTAGLCQIPDSSTCH